MSQRTASRRGREPYTAALFGASAAGDESPGTRLVAENERLRASAAEVDAWYRLLQAEHATLQAEHARTSRRTTELQTEVNRLDAENRELQNALDALNTTRTRTQHPRGMTTMRTSRLFQALAPRRWGTFAAVAVAVATLLARDPGVREWTASAARKAGLAAGPVEPAPSGYLAYARMVNAREAYDRARSAYNRDAETLKGDALLDAQDALRAARASYAAARAHFLPALWKECRRAEVSFPAEAAALLTAQRDRTAD